MAAVRLHKFSLDPAKNRYMPWSFEIESQTWIDYYMVINNSLRYFIEVLPLISQMSCIFAMVSKQTICIRYIVSYICNDIQENAEVLASNASSGMDNIHYKISPRILFSKTFRHLQCVVLVHLQGTLLYFDTFCISSTDL